MQYWDEEASPKRFSHPFVVKGYLGGGKHLESMEITSRLKMLSKPSDVLKNVWMKKDSESSNVSCSRTQRIARLGLEPKKLDRESSALTFRPPAPPRGEM